MQQDSKAGIKKNIQSLLYNTGYVSWDFDNIWKIEEGTTLAYFQNVSKPTSVNQSTLQYESFDIQGAGTAIDPYVITTSLQLQKVNENLEACYKLGANIDLSGIDWTIIGNASYPFKGTLDGNGYTISNLTINKDANNIGLFGYNSGTLKNVKIDNFNIKGKSYVGGLVSKNDGTVTGCSITNSTIEGTENYAGGLIGYNTGTIISSTAQGTINGIDYVGGLVRMFNWKYNNKFFSNDSKWRNKCRRTNRICICK